MVEGLKKNKIVDVLLIDDDIDLLGHRCQNAYDDVNYIVLLIPINHEKISEVLSEISIWKDKISILYTENNNFFEKINLEKILPEFKSLDLSFDDLVCFSKLSELPEYKKFNDVLEQIVYGPVVLRNTNFVNHTSFYTKDRHMGTIVVNYSFLIKNYVELKTVDESRNNVITSFFNTSDNGFFFQNFGQRFLQKNLSICSYKSECNFKKDFLVEYIPEDICNNKILVIFNMNQSRVEVENLQNFEKILNFNFTKDYKLKENLQIGNLSTINIFLPPIPLYDIKPKYNFNLHFGLKEISRILTNLELLECQIIDFLVYPTIEEQSSKSISWETLENLNFVEYFYDELSQFI